MTHLIGYSELKDYYSINYVNNYGTQKRKIKKNIYGFVIQNLDSVFDDEMLYLETWKNFIDKHTEKEGFHNNFEILLSCRTSFSDNSLIDSVYILKNKTDELKIFCQNIVEESQKHSGTLQRTMKIVPLNVYLQRHSTIRDFESLNEYKMVFNNLPSYHTKHLFKSNQWVSYSEDEIQESYSE